MNEQLLLRYFAGECTEDDLIEIDQWISSDEANATYLFEMERLWTLKDELRFSDKKEIEKAYSRLITSLEKTGKIRSARRFNIKRGMRYAAAVLLFGLLSLNVYQYYTKAGRRAGTDNIIEVSRGHQVSLTLSDGTKVWLNSDSRLVYPSSFSGDARIVGLQGEGYFEVAHNTKIPFIVKSKPLSVKVLGTKFNLKSYPGEIASVILKEGRVEVYTADEKDRTTLNPNEQARYSEATGIVSSRYTDAFAGESWLYGGLVFSESSLKEITNALERKFDVQIVITDPLLTEEIFTCHTQSGVTLVQILDLLKDTRRLDYKIEGKKVFILKTMLME